MRSHFFAFGVSKPCAVTRTTGATKGKVRCAPTDDRYCQELDDVADSDCGGWCGWPKQSVNNVQIMVYATRTGDASEVRWSGGLGRADCVDADAQPPRTHPDLR